MTKPAVLHALATLALSGVLVGVRGAAAGTLVGEQVTRLVPACSQECLLKIMADFKADMLAKKEMALRVSEWVKTVGPGPRRACQSRRSSWWRGRGIRAYFADASRAAAT